MTTSPEEILELLYRALNSPYGILVSTTDPVRTKQHFYRERQKDPDLSCLSILTSPFNPQGELIVFRNEEKSNG